MSKSIRVIVSGGGTGGHIFPAVSIANAVKAKRPDAEILFVGAQDRMEMQRVPDAGYNIVGLPVAGFDRKRLWRNVAVIIKLLKSQIKAYKVVKKFKPDVAVGVGGYASGPTLKMAGMMGVPTLIQEQNSYAGVTNKLLARKAEKICVAYSGMERFFPAEKIMLTGNPVRQQLLVPTMGRDEAIASFGLDPQKHTVLVLGGSLGARTLNNAFMQGLDMIGRTHDVQFILQTGKYYYNEVVAAVKKQPKLDNLCVTDFIKDMNVAYTAADLVVSRAGAGSISEFCLLHKPVILIPSPNVAEDHQTKNALALADKNAAVYIKDSEAVEQLLPTAIATVMDEKKLDDLKIEIAKLALPSSAEIIADEVIKLAER